MPRFLRSHSIRSSLVLLSIGSAAIALCMAIVCLAVNDVALMRQAKNDHLEAQAKMLAFNGVGVLSFGDSEAAEQLLKSMGTSPTVEQACLFDETGNVLASYSPAETKGPPLNVVPLPPEGTRLTPDRFLEVCLPIEDDGMRLGWVAIRANTTDLQQQFFNYLVITALVMVVAMLGASLLARPLQHAIAKPIGRLADAAKRITVQRDYSIRVEHSSSNEIGQLCAAFNGMLDEIQVSKAALQGAHDDLENRVVERTSQLTEEIKRRTVVQAELQTACLRAEAANRAKSEFLANMSHEIRTPLNGILGFTNFLINGADRGDPVARAEFLGSISTSGEHLLLLINDILDLSKIEAGQMGIESEPCSPHDVINQVVSVLRVKAHEKGLSLNYGWSTKTPERILTDGARLRQVLINLVGNAIKFTNTGSVTLDASLIAKDHKLQIRVKDTGVGIPEDQRAVIFDPFVQADNSVTRQYGGTGLGLAICRKLSAALGGQLSVESEEGQGSTFILEIDTGPMTGVNILDAPPTDAMLTSKRAAAEEPAGSIDGASILLVEDGVTNRELLKIILKDAGAVVETAENGWEGVQLATKQPFDLILMDMQMPVMDGYSASTRLREQGLETPIVALTAHAMKGDEQKCLNAGCTSYLTKPVEAATLLATAAKLLDKDKVSLHADQHTPSSPHHRQVLSSLPLEQPVYREIVEEFVEFLSDQVASMRAAYDSRSFDELERLAHAMKGAGGTAGFDVLTQPAASLEQTIKGENLEEAEQALNELLSLSQRISETPQVPAHTS